MEHLPEGEQTSGLPPSPRKALCQPELTDIIECANDKVRVTCRNVKRWRHREHILRWMAAAYLEAEPGFHRIKGYRGGDAEENCSQNYPVA
ncbi:hypothetical protein kuro4_15820 [Gelria sp. Kuro-4]|nr:hypothetical protein kuro4_15820 [Gelria sp. Kuro-4]